MKKREPISHIMTKNVITLNVTDSLAKAENVMEENDIRHIPVVSGKKLVGMLSLTDIKRVSYVDSFNGNNTGIDTAVNSLLSIPQVMVVHPETITTEETVRDAAKLLAKKEYHALPVVEDDELVGIVTTTDLIQYLLEQY
jgi:CBS domain-containing membrane protein